MWSAPKDISGFAEHCREQAGWCEELGSPFTAALCEAFASDAETGGVVARLAATVAPPHRQRATSLRLAGALHFGVLSGRAERLSKLYPKASEDWQIAELWPVAAEYLEADYEQVAAFIQSDPQTNETRRSIALLPGFQAIADRFRQPMHLLELGASAGLNQCWDKFSYAGNDWQRSGGSGGVRVSTDWQGAPPHSEGALEIASRAGCDLNPIDVSDPAARQRLKAYTWADQPDRLARLDAAMALAVAEGVRIEQADAADWLGKKLAARPASGTTVVYHSVFLFYPPRAVRDRIIQLITDAGEAASEAAPLAWLCMEPASVFERDNPKLGQFQVRLQTWPGGASEVVGTTDGHVTHFRAA